MPPVAAQSPALTISAYAEAAKQTDRFASDATRREMLQFGFFGEVGGLLSAIKKVGRDQLRESETDVAGEELGDALWYLVSAANANGIPADDLGAACMRALRAQFHEIEQAAPAAVSFRNIDGLLAVHGASLAGRRTELLCEFAGLSGELLAPRQPRLHDEQFNPRPEEFGKIMAALASVASSFNLKLEDLARDNLRKISGRWPGENAVYVGPFDDAFPPHEQLPRSFEIDFIERGSGPSAHTQRRFHRRPAHRQQCRAR
ncbi:nucleoside triphosphate pyrophosphohydrolase family protein [Burkholderia sp. TSV86]|uniref:nucleoside triphosphate pyrophosphohydrolase family protein n=1 Tax=Burkholderia sp. TSV86 TaxID=1385594 RepID=UPI000AC8028E|nr:nucleoside triphosphate pyrophosphohydrolase family protein [Burkholderia sp. TSV86]